MRLTSISLGLTEGPDRDRHACGRVGRRQHVASSIKDATRIDHHARRVHFARDHALRLNLYPALREDHSVEAARDDHAVPFNLSLDLGVFSEHDGLLGNNVSLHVSVNAECPGQRQRAFERNALIDETGPLFAETVFRCAWPLPCHEDTPRGLTTNLAWVREKSTPLAWRVVECNS